MSSGICIDRRLHTLVRYDIVVERLLLERASVVPAPRLPVAFLFRRPPSTAGCEQSLRHHPRCSRTRTTRIPTASARPRRRSTYPREHQRGQLSAAGIRIASNLLVDEERRKETRLHSRSLPRATLAPPPSRLRHTARRGPPPTPRVRVRLRRASPLACSLPEPTPCKRDPRLTIRTTSSSSASDAPPRPRPRPREDGGVGVSDVNVDVGEDEGSLIRERKRSKESGAWERPRAPARRVGVGGGIDARPTVAMVHGDELRGVGAELERALLGRRRAFAGCRRPVIVTLVHPPILKRSALWMAGGALRRTRVRAQQAKRSRRTDVRLLAVRGTRSLPLVPRRARTLPALDLAPAALQRGHRLRSECGSAASCSTSFMSFVYVRARAAFRRRARVCRACEATPPRRSTQAIRVATGGDMNGGAGAARERAILLSLPSISTPPPPAGVSRGARDAREGGCDPFLHGGSLYASAGGLCSGGAGENGLACVWRRETRYKERRKTSNACVMEVDGKGRGKIAVEDGERRQRNADEGWARKHIDGMGPLHVIASKRHKEEREWMGMTELESAKCTCAREWIRVVNEEARRGQGKSGGMQQSRGGYENIDIFRISEGQIGGPGVWRTPGKGM
ncbi:hypothetical protein DFH09DRAFT_1438380 [Mycena vulgaris]|nr:hypothetical protein DFH09DRAFT_1438380 [Mycena vulgaris]